MAPSGTCSGRAQRLQGLRPAGCGMCGSACHERTLREWDAPHHGNGALPLHCNVLPSLGLLHPGPDTADIPTANCHPSCDVAACCSCPAHFHTPSSAEEVPSTPLMSTTRQANIAFWLFRRWPHNKTCLFSIRRELQSPLATWQSPGW